jgi:hypothetical protein
MFASVCAVVFLTRGFVPGDQAKLGFTAGFEFAVGEIPTKQGKFCGKQIHWQTARGTHGGIIGGIIVVARAVDADPSTSPRVLAGHAVAAISGTRLCFGARELAGRTVGADQSTSSRVLSGHAVAAIISTRLCF